MKSYNVYFDKEKNQYVCELEENGVKSFVKLKSALLRIDDYQYQEVSINNNTLILNGNRARVKIDDYSGLDISNLLKKQYIKIEKIVKEIQRQKAKEKVVTTLTKFKIPIIVGGLALLMLTGGKTIVNINSKAVEVSAEDPLKGEPIEEDEINNDDNQIENIEEESTIINEQSENNIYIDYPELTSAEQRKYENAYNKCYSYVEDSAKRWGLDPNVVMAMLTQESGGLETNILQIEYNKWANDEMIYKVYNYEEQKYKCYKVTDNPDIVSNNKYTVIRSNDLKNMGKNIETGCIFFRWCIDSMDQHLMAGILCYNQGYGNMKKIFRVTNEFTGLNKDELLSDQTNVDFYPYAYITKVGDKEYLQHVCKYLQDAPITIRFLDEEGNNAEKSVFIKSSLEKENSHIK